VWQNALGFGLIALGASGLMVLALARIRMGEALKLRGVLFMGRISYGYYLVHFPIILLVLRYGVGHVSLAWLAVVVVVGSIGLAWGLNVAVELPAIKLGRAWAGTLERWWVKRGAVEAASTKA
jgi:peptidoglycan/LPS O-acetylase OafA/YrhL